MAGSRLGGGKNLANMVDSLSIEPTSCLALPGEVPQVACSLYTFNRTDQLPSFAWGKCQGLFVPFSLSAEVASCLDLPAGQCTQRVQNT